MRIGTREVLKARREQAKAWLEAEQRVILVCAGTGCIAGGAMKVYDKLQELPFFERGVRFFVITGPNGERVEFNQYL